MGGDDQLDLGRENERAEPDHDDTQHRHRRPPGPAGHECSQEDKRIERDEQCIVAGCLRQRRPGQGDRSPTGETEKPRRPDQAGASRPQCATGCEHRDEEEGTEDRVGQPIGSIHTSSLTPCERPCDGHEERRRKGPEQAVGAEDRESPRPNRRCGEVRHGRSWLRDDAGGCVALLSNLSGRALILAGALPF